jgi:hypothetical protein
VRDKRQALQVWHVVVGEVGWGSHSDSQHASIMLAHTGWQLMGTSGRILSFITPWKICDICGTQCRSNSIPSPPPNTTVVSYPHASFAT